MSWEYAGLKGSNKTNTSAGNRLLNRGEKPIEIFVFIDPLCPECWSLEPYLKKLTIEYGDYLIIRPIVTGHLNNLNKDKFDRPKRLKEIWQKTACRTGMSCDGDVWIDNPISSPWIASLAIKAAELQGKRAGRIFLRKLQENLFLMKQNISDEDVLMACAREANLDIEEFKNDLYSSSAKKAFQGDMKLTQEMEVDYIPTIVFFNQDVEEHGIKISGLYPYDIYLRVLQQMLQWDPVPAEKPALEDFLAKYEVVGNKEVAVVYDWTIAKADKELKKLQLKQIVKRIPAKYGTFWRYIGEKPSI
ncbi:ClpXP adapter SpxH family protein [Lentibacillus sp. L22]|uniref:ClpXP adapter SpxH family protein n=1 Tax=Lentibacillus TaxID=175304 RepID=UPI0022B13A38|nr:ClpXP adapter SpxH family protein [Lentibacillus daqui]